MLCLVSLSCVQLSASPWTIAHQAPLSMGLSRQGDWSGLPCPPPGDLPNPGMEPGSPTLQADSLLSEPSGKPKNAGVGCHALLQGIFATQGLNPSLPHCRRILYHLSHQGSPNRRVDTTKENKVRKESRNIFLKVSRGGWGGKGENREEL